MMADRAKNVSSYVILFLIGWQVNCFTLRFQETATSSNQIQRNGFIYTSIKNQNITSLCFDRER